MCNGLPLVKVIPFVANIIILVVYVVFLFNLIHSLATIPVFEVDMSIFRVFLPKYVLELSTETLLPLLKKLLAPKASISDFKYKFLPPTLILFMTVFNSFLAEFTLVVASLDAELIASLFLVSAYDLAELRVDDTLVSTLDLVS